jgi:hypothetical protein
LGELLASLEVDSRGVERLPTIIFDVEADFGAWASKLGSPSSHMRRLGLPRNRQHVLLLDHKHALVIDVVIKLLTDRLLARDRQLNLLFLLFIINFKLYVVLVVLTYLLRIARQEFVFFSVDLNVIAFLLDHEVVHQSLVVQVIKHGLLLNRRVTLLECLVKLSNVRLRLNHVPCPEALALLLLLELRALLQFFAPGLFSRQRFLLLASIVLGIILL